MVEPGNQRAGDHSKYVKDLRERLSCTFDLVLPESKKQAECNKTCKLVNLSISLGTLCLLRRLLN